VSGYPVGQVGEEFSAGLARVHAWTPFPD
jgi:hypothetical protein